MLLRHISSIFDFYFSVCLINGKCVEVDKTWMDKSKCLYYKCVFNPETNEANPEVVHVGELNILKTSHSFIQ